MTSTSIYEKVETAKSYFRPTYLYIKRHKITGHLYFGKTFRPDVEHYNGSGRMWKDHQKKYGKDIETVWVSDAFTEDRILDLVEFALFFSEFHDIVHSLDENGKKIWANLIVEDGIGGRGKVGRKATTEQEFLNRSLAQKKYASENIEKKRATRLATVHRTWKGKKKTPEQIEKSVKHRRGIPRTKEFRNTLSQLKSGKGVYRSTLTGEQLYLATDDTRVVSGEFVGLGVGLANYYGPDGTKYRIPCGDPMIQELGLMGSTSKLGKEYKKRQNTK